MTNIFRNQRLVSLTPILTTLMLEGANLGQLWRMWTHRTAAGQELMSWVMVNIALWLWLNWYRVKTPNERFAILATRLGICLNTLVILSVAYFRYAVGRG
jgi:uncharacterized protein with PQ loop repeat